jgi:hypothetical protein
MSSNDELLNLLRGLEIELHQLVTRSDPARLGALLHPEFEEFGRSGLRYSRSDVLIEFSEAELFPQIAASDFDMRLVSPDVALLTYVSAHVDGPGAFSRTTLRSSVWVRTAAGWQLVFHQGTPASGESVCET